MNRVTAREVILSALLGVLASWAPTPPAQAQTFTDVAVSAGVADTSGAAWGNEAWGDYDADGDQDLYVTNWGRFVKGFVTKEGYVFSDTLIAVPCQLYRNNGDGTFTDVAASAGVADNGTWAGSATWADYDGDGDQDLYVTRTSELPNLLYRNNGDGTFADVAASTGVGDHFGNVALWGDYNSDGWLDLYLSNMPSIDAEGNLDPSSPPSRLYRNKGDGTFTEIGAGAGVSTYGNVAAAGDYDNDGDLDIYLPTHASPGPAQNPNRLFQNKGDGTFTDVAASAGVASVGGTLSVSGTWADYDNDGDLDLYVVNNEAPNNLYRNNGDGTFTDVAAAAGVGDSKTGYGNGAVWGDFDNDGFVDLYVTNIASSSPNRLFHNNGDGTFTEIGASASVNNSDGIGVASADYDNDGFLDLYLSNVQIVDGVPVGGLNRLYRNQGNSNHWLIVRLKGTISNRDAIGARVIAVTGAKRQRRDVESAGPGWGSQPSLPVEFGFGSTAVVDSLIIRWPSGIVQVLTDVATNRHLTLQESQAPTPTAVADGETASEASRGQKVPSAYALAQNSPNPFNPETTIRYELPEVADIRLTIANLAGQTIRTLVHGTREAGRHEVVWDGRDDAGRAMASGIYLYRLEAIGKGVVETKRMVLVR